MGGRLGCAEVMQAVLHNLPGRSEVVQEVVQTIYIAHLHNLPFGGFGKWKTFEVVQRLCRPIAGCTPPFLTAAGTHNACDYGARPAHTYQHRGGNVR